MTSIFNLKIVSAFLPNNFSCRIMLCVYYRLGFICCPRVVQGGILCTQDQSVFLRFHVEAPLAALFVM